MKKLLTTCTLLAFLAFPITFIGAQEKTEAPAKAAAAAPSDKAAEQQKKKQAKADCKKEGKKGKELKSCVKEKLKQ